MSAEDWKNPILESYIDEQEPDTDNRMLTLDFAYQDIRRIIREREEEEASLRFSRRIGGLRYSIGEDLDSWMDEERTTTFQQDLMDLIHQKGMSPSEFYKAAWMDRKLFSAMKSRENYSPKKDTAIACCLALHLTPGEAEALLHKAGYELSRGKTSDLVIRYCLEHGIYKIDEVNELLNRFKENTIRI